MNGDQRCETCRFYMDYACHRHAPIVGDLRMTPNALWPGVARDHYCGDWEAQRADQKAES